MKKEEIDFLRHNESAWNKQALDQNEWSQPVNSALINAAKQGIWDVHLTPKPLPKQWLGDIRDKKILCLASAGGAAGSHIGSSRCQGCRF